MSSKLITGNVTITLNKNNYNNKIEKMLSDNIIHTSSKEFYSKILKIKRIP